MIHRRFGKTGIRMPVLTCGGMRYQHSWKDLKRVPRASQENVEACIRRALELGINHIETARGYGTSELQLGRILPRLPREEIIVQTKIGPSEKASDFRRALETSLERLRLDRVDLLGIHGVNTPELLEWCTRKGGCLEAARRAVDEGLVGHVGFSTHGPLEVILRAIDTGEFEYVNLHWYYFNQRNWPAIERARRFDMGVFIISPNDKGGMLQSPPARLRRLTAPLSPMLFNDLFCLVREEVHTLSIGASRPSDFDEHAKVIPLLRGNGRRLSDTIVRRLREERVARVGADYCTDCRRCLPCPEDVNIPEILRLRNLAVAYGMRDFGRMRYNLFGNGGHWFPGQDAAHCTECGDCLPRCPENLPIIRLLKDAHRRLTGESVRRLSESG